MPRRETISAVGLFAPVSDASVCYACHTPSPGTGIAADHCRMCYMWYCASCCCSEKKSLPEEFGFGPTPQLLCRACSVVVRSLPAMFLSRVALGSSGAMLLPNQYLGWEVDRPRSNSAWSWTKYIMPRFLRRGGGACLSHDIYPSGKVTLMSWRPLNPSTVISLDGAPTFPVRNIALRSILDVKFVLPFRCVLTVTVTAEKKNTQRSTRSSQYSTEDRSTGLHRRSTFATPKETGVTPSFVRSRSACEDRRPPDVVAVCLSVGECDSSGNFTPDPSATKNFASTMHRLAEVARDWAARRVLTP